MLTKIIEGHKFRKYCRTIGLNRNATELLTYIHLATDKGRKGPEVLEKSRLVDLQLRILNQFSVFQPHAANIRRLYEDSSFRNEWHQKYKKYANLK